MLKGYTKSNGILFYFLSNSQVLSDNYHSVLQIDPVTLAEEGMIECTVWNTGGSSTALIEVIVVPSERDKIGSGYTGGKRKSFEKIPAIIKGPEDIFAIRGSEVLLEALFVGKPEPSVVWLKGVCSFFLLFVWHIFSLCSIGYNFLCTSAIPSQTYLHFS